jgi:hypothetical protein
MWNIAPLVLSTILKDFFTSFIVKSKILRNHWLRNYFVKLVDRGECKIIGTRLTMFGRRIVEFLHKCTCQIFFFTDFIHSDLWDKKTLTYIVFQIPIRKCLIMHEIVLHVHPNTYFKLLFSKHIVYWWYYGYL